MKAILTLLALASLTIQVRAQEILFQDDFKSRLGMGWSWVREHRDAWRARERGLEVRIEPGNMWGPQNDARNLLVRPAPDTTTHEIEVDVTFENRPTNQYEQVDLVWYYDDSNMVKLGEELVDGKLSIVMGREEGDKTRTLAIIPLASARVRLRRTMCSSCAFTADLSRSRSLLVGLFFSKRLASASKSIFDRSRPW